MGYNLHKFFAERSTTPFQTLCFGVFAALLVLGAVPGWALLAFTIWAIALETVVKRWLASNYYMHDAQLVEEDE